MLDISKPLTTGKVQSYYRSEYSSASNSYFTEGGTLRGEWHGRLAPALKLSGEVTAAAFDRLAEGQHPETGEQLIKHRDTIKTKAGEELGHRAGWDLTFNAPKTISLTGLVGGDEQVRKLIEMPCGPPWTQQRSMYRLGSAAIIQPRRQASGSLQPSSTTQRDPSMAIRPRT